MSNVPSSKAAHKAAPPTRALQKAALLQKAKGSREERIKTLLSYRLPYDLAEKIDNIRANTEEFERLKNECRFIYEGGTSESETQQGDECFSPTNPVQIEELKKMKKIVLNELIITKQDTIDMFAEVVSSSPNLETLMISSRHDPGTHTVAIGDYVAEKLAEAMQKSNSLKVLILPYCNITSIGAKRIAEALKTNKTLQKLALTGNMIKEDGAIAIVEALKTNNSLQKLGLAHCGIYDRDKFQRIISTLGKKSLIVNY